MKKINYLVLIVLTTIMSVSAIAQELPLPSPAAKIEQRIGLTDVTITYSRPSVKGRVIFGELVPNDKVWRTGANVNTLITFSDDVKINGQALKAGTYSFFTIPSKTEWKVMFNSVTDAWGAYDYKSENDVLTLTTKAKEGSKKETMSFSFENLTNTSASLILAWDAVVIDLTVEVDVDKRAMENIDKAIKEATDENRADVYRNAAKYTASSGKHLEEGLKWINEAIKIKESWYSYWIKADVQHNAGDNAGAKESAKKAIEIGEAGAKESGKPFKYKEQLEKAITEFK